MFQAACILIEGQNLLQLPCGPDRFYVARDNSGWQCLLSFMVWMAAVFDIGWPFRHSPWTGGFLLLSTKLEDDEEVLQSFFYPPQYPKYCRQRVSLCSTFKGGQEICRRGCDNLDTKLLQVISYRFHLLKMT
jgi:hypothetical protein